MSNYIGIDIGGTGTRLVVTNKNHKIIKEAKVATEIFSASTTEKSTALLINWIRAEVSILEEILAVGIGSTGPVNLVSGKIDNPDTLPQFSGIDLPEEISKKLKLPVWIDNDANAAGMAEAMLGAGKNYSAVLCITIGTGLGLSLIKQGRPVRALDGQHPEGGHISIPNRQAPCYCGLDACWEMSASRLALEAIAKSNSELQIINNKNDYSAISNATWQEFGIRIAEGLITHLVISRPDVVVICGSIIEHWQKFKGSLLNSLDAHRGFKEAKNVYPSSLGELSGAIGATCLARYQIGKAAFPR